MHPVLFQIGPVRIFSYGLMMALAFIIALVVAQYRAPKFGFKKDIISEIIFWAIVGGIAGGRIYYVLINLDFYLSNPLEVFSLWKGGLVVYGGLAGGMIACVAVLRKHGQNVLDWADFLIGCVPLGQAIGRIGCFLNGCCFGSQCSVPWAVRFPENSFAAEKYGIVHHVHPVQLYDCVLLFVMSFFMIRAFGKRRFRGQIFCLYPVVYGISRFCVEFFRGDYQTHPMGLTPAQVFSLVAVFCGVVAYFTARRFSPRLEPVCANRA